MLKWCKNLALSRNAECHTMRIMRNGHGYSPQFHQMNKQTSFAYGGLQGRVG